MGVSTFVRGIKPPDDKHRKMVAIYNNCEDLEIELPGDVDEYFEGEEPEEDGVLVDIPYEEWSSKAGNSTGVEVELSKIPKHVTRIRFENSW